MEIQIPYSILFTFICFLLLIRRLSSSSKKSSKLPLPPGPPKLPIIGNLHQMVGDLPHHRLRDLSKKYGPLMHLQLGETSNVVFSSAEMVSEMMKTHDTIFSNRPGTLANNILAYGDVNVGYSPYGHYWRQLRKIITIELLSVKKVQSINFKAIREEEVGSLIKYVTENEGRVINLHKKLFPLAISIIARAAVGKSNHADAILSYMTRTMQLGTGLLIVDLFPSLKFLPWLTGVKAQIEKIHTDEADAILQDIINDHVEKNKRNPNAEPEDLVDGLLQIQKENDLDIRISHSNIKAIVQDMFFGATETTATILEWAMAELLKSPETMKEAQAEVRRVSGNKGYVDESELIEMKYLEAVLKETMRLHPPLPLLVPRLNSERCEINGYEIPARTRILVNAWALGRDPKYWKEAEKFQPQRFLNSSIDYNFRGTEFEYLPFGGGRRVCPGIAFGYAAVNVALARLLYHFDWKLPNGMKPEELDMDETPGVNATRKNNLCVIAKVYRP